MMFNRRALLIPISENMTSHVIRPIVSPLRYELREKFIFTYDINNIQDYSQKD